MATVHSAHDYEGLRGPQFDAAWVDELAKWKKSEEAWDQLQFALRLGDQPQVCVTTTPRNVGVLKALLDAPSTVTSHAPCAHAIVVRGWGGRSWTVCCWWMRRARCGPRRG